MATTVSPQTLTVTLSETINLNGQSINSENQLTIPSITSIDKRIVTIPFASQVTVLNFGAAVAAGTVIAANVKYIRITNKDSVNFVRVRVTDVSGETYDQRIDAGKSCMFGNALLSASSTGAAFSAFVTADNISAQADTAPVDIEIFSASI